MTSLRPLAVWVKRFSGIIVRRKSGPFQFCAFQALLFHLKFLKPTDTSSLDREAVTRAQGSVYLSGRGLARFQGQNSDRLEENPETHFFSVFNLWIFLLCIYFLVALISCPLNGFDFVLNLFSWYTVDAALCWLLNCQRTAAHWLGGLCFIPLPLFLWVACLPPLSNRAPTMYTYCISSVLLCSQMFIVFFVFLLCCVLISHNLTMRWVQVLMFLITIQFRIIYKYKCLYSPIRICPLVVVKYNH